MLDERYPHLAFLLTLEKEDLQEWREALDLKDVEVLYIYGIDSARTYPFFQDWLHESPERDLVYLEDDLEEIRKVEGHEFLKDPQVHLFFLRVASLREIARCFPVKHVEVISTPSYAKIKASRFRKINLELKRNSVLENAFLLEELFSHLLFRNFLPNFQLLSKAFFGNKLKSAFQGIPAIVCGAGPSLSSSIPALKTVENRALILSGGSSIAALSSQGILPHLTFAIDPNEEEGERLRAASAFQVPLLYAHRVRHSIFRMVNGPLGYVRTLCANMAELWLEEKLSLTTTPMGMGLGEEALSVTTLCIAYAEYLGCNPIILTGIDLAYTDLQSYASGVILDSSVSLKKKKEDKRAAEQLLRCKGKDRKTIFTAIKWKMEAESIARFIKQHKETQFFDATKGGIEIPSLTYQPLEKVIGEQCQKMYDLRGILHTEIEENRLNISKESIESALHEFKASLLRSRTIVEEILEELKSCTEESGKVILLQSDLQEEIAYLLLFKGVLARLSHTLDRRSDISFQERERLKWKEIHARLDQCLHFAYLV